MAVAARASRCVASAAAAVAAARVATARASLCRARFAARWDGCASGCAFKTADTLLSSGAAVVWVPINGHENN